MSVGSGERSARAQGGSSAPRREDMPPERVERLRRIRRWKRIVGGVLAVVVLYLAFTTAQVFAAESWDHTRPAGAAVVLGAAQYDGRPSAALQARLDRALQLYEDGVVPRVVLTGGSQEGDRFTEAYAGLEYLLKAGVPEDDVVVVDDGSSTWESLAASARVLRKEGITKVQLVSDPYHSFRLEAIAAELGLDGKVSPTDTGAGNGQLFRESMLVAGGRIIGYRRLVNLLES